MYYIAAVILELLRWEFKIELQRVEDENCKHKASINFKSPNPKSDM
jgi:hypothetical protein